MGSDIPQAASNSDEYFLRHSLVFARSLKDLRNIRAQLHSAVEYFESSYREDEHKQLVEETLKDYLTKALVSTVDHLGSVAYKVNSFLDQKVDEFSAARIRLSCIEQRLRAHQEFTGRCGLSQQSLVIETSMHFKRYSIPVMESPVVRKLKPIPDGCILTPKDDVHTPKREGCSAKACQGNAAKPYSRLPRRGHSRMQSAEFSPRPLTFSFMRIDSSKEAGNQAVSPLSLQLKRSRSVDSWISPSANYKQRCPSEAQRSIRVLLNPERSKGKELQVCSRKGKNLFRALLSIHQSRKEGVPFRFRDDK